jgi:polyhydroxybutyrate depolymerase
VNRPTLDPNRDTSCVNDIRGNDVPPSMPPETLAGVVCAMVNVDGVPRSYLVYLPARMLSPAPLVFMYHGSGGTGPQFHRISGWREQADTTGLVAVFPTAVEGYVLENERFGTKWNAYGIEREIDVNRRPRNYPAAAPFPADDVKFTRTMIDALRAMVLVDENRIFVSGFSNGATMTARLAIEASDVIDGVTGVVGVLHEVMTPRARIPRFLIAGNRDDGLMAAMGLTTPLPIAFEALRALPQMDAAFRYEAATWQLEDTPLIAPRSRGTLARWVSPRPGNTSGNVLWFMILDGMTHQYPNGRNYPVVAAEQFWSFYLDPKANPAR